MAAYPRVVRKSVVDFAVVVDSDPSDSGARRVPAAGGDGLRGRSCSGWFKPFGSRADDPTDAADEDPAGDRAGAFHVVVGACPGAEESTFPRPFVEALLEELRATIAEEVDVTLLAALFGDRGDAAGALQTGGVGNGGMDFTRP